MTRPAYDRDPRLRRLQADVVRADQGERGPFVVLTDTVLYPEGGGQPRDFGTLDDQPVLDVVKASDGYRHQLATPHLGSRATVELDWARRWDHMQQHTGQHLLSAIAQDRFGLATTSFHLGEATSDVELDQADVSTELLDDVAAAVAEAIEAAIPVRTRWVDPSQVPDGVRSRGLPDGHRGDVRLVEIEGLDVTTCGGTHVASTAEIGGLALLGTESMRGGTRVHFVAGTRWRRRLAADEELLASLRRALGCADSEMVELVERRLDEGKALRRELEGERTQLAESAASALVATDGPWSDAHFEGRDAGFLRAVVNAVRAIDPGRRVLLTAERDQHVFFVVSGAADDGGIPEIGAAVASALGGRGGGRGGVFQGKGTSLDRRDAAVAALAG